MGLVINLKADSTTLVCRTENTKRFFRDIRMFDVLTKEEEQEIFMKLADYKKKLESAKKNDDHEGCRLYKAKIDEIREQIVNANQRLCVSAARNWATTDTLLDYVNEANTGLLEAIDKFDYTKGFKFASYAMWYIKRSLNEYHYNTKPIVHRTNNSKTWSLISKASNKFMQDNERNPSTEELKDLVNQKLKKGIKDNGDLIDLHMTMVDDFSLSDEDTQNHADIADYNRASSSENDYEAQTEADFQKKVISSMLEILTPRDRKIIQMRFGLIEVNGIQREFELSEVAEEVGLTSERIRQLELVILDKLRKEYHERTKDL